MLLTTCPECSAQFKVQTEQLNVRQGRVMCGRCRHVFNAFESLTRIEDATQSEANVATPDTDFVTPAQSPAPILAAPPASVAAPITSAPPTPVAYEAFRAMGNKPSAKSSGKDKSSLLFVPYKNTSENAWTWGVSAALLGLFLAAQLLYFFRVPIVQTYPQFRPQLAQVCKLAGCSISWGRDKEAIAIVSSDFVEPPGKPGQYLLATVIANHSNTIQDLPALDLRLTDSNNQPLMRRILQPAEYLGRTLKSDEGLAPGAEVYVNLSVAIDKKIAASGYAFDVFYP